MSKRGGNQQNTQINVKLRKFDMSKIGDDKVILFIGKRNTGKSVLVLDYLYHNRDFPLGTVISPTDNYNYTYRPHIPSIFIHEEYTPELLDQILLRQKQISKMSKVENPVMLVSIRALSSSSMTVWQMETNG
jgi:hypothetical protein